MDESDYALATLDVIEQDDASMRSGVTLGMYTDEQLTEEIARRERVSLADVAWETLERKIGEDVYADAVTISKDHARALLATRSST